MDEEKIAVNWFDKKHIIYYGLGAVILFFLLFGLGRTGTRRNYTANMNTNYYTSLHRAAGYVSEIDNELKKVKVTEDPQSAALLYASVWSSAQNAHENIASLPYNQDMVKELLTYLNEASQLSYSLMEKSIKGATVSAEEQIKLDNLMNKSSIAAKELTAVVSDIHLNEQSVLWDRLRNENSAQFDGQNGVQMQSLLGSMIHVKNQISDTAPVVQDSGNNAYNTPKLLEDAFLVGVNEGAASVRNYLKSYGVKEVNYIGATDVTAENVTGVYTYEVVPVNQNEAEFTIDITQEGGYPLMMLKHTRDYSGTNFMSAEKAIRLADKFIMELGYDNMRAVYHEIFDSVIYISYYNASDDIIYYTDEIKVKVNLTNGDILGFWAGEYINNHYSRTNIANITTETAMSQLKEDFIVDSVCYAVIKNTEGEALCYEFTGHLDDQQYKIYINAHNGSYEKTELIYNNNKGIYAR